MFLRLIYGKNVKAEVFDELTKENDFFKIMIFLSRIIEKEENMFFLRLYRECLSYVFDKLMKENVFFFQIMIILSRIIGNMATDTEMKKICSFFNIGRNTFLMNKFR
ncbi:hypothetical protein ACFFRR_007276 [Megaselia abdita]